MKNLNKNTITDNIIIRFDIKTENNRIYHLQIPMNDIARNEDKLCTDFIKEYCENYLIGSEVFESIDEIRYVGYHIPLTPEKKKLIKTIITLLLGKVKEISNKNKISVQNVIPAEELRYIIDLHLESKITYEKVKNLIDLRFQENKHIEEILKEKSYITLVDDNLLLKSVIKEVIEENSDKVKQFINGKENLINYFVGLVHKKTNKLYDANEIKKETLLCLKTIN